MLDKKTVGELYLKGFSYEYISDSLDSKKDTVRKCIQRHFLEFRNSHKAERMRRKETDRITRFETKQHMTDKDFIKRNRSIYKTLPNGDIVLDKSKAENFSFDTPRRYSNEFSKDRVNKNISKSGYRNANILFASNSFFRV